MSDLVSDPNVINKTNSRKQTAVYCAAMNGHESIVRLLLGQSAINLDANANGSTALHGMPFNFSFPLPLPIPLSLQSPFPLHSFSFRRLSSTFITPCNCGQSI